MKFLSAVSLVVFSQVCWAGEHDLAQTQLSLARNNELMDYMIKNSEDIFETIMRGGPGSTELLSQVAGASLTSQTQAWFRCSRKHGVGREIFAENIQRYTAYTNEQEMCAKSCYIEESKMVADGKLDPAMVSLIMIMGYGDDKDIHDFTKALANKCNSELPKADHGTCQSAKYLDCFVRGLGQAGIYMPGQILNEFRSPYIMELTSR